MDLQKIASTGTAVVVVGTGAVVGGNSAIDNYTGGPEKRETAKTEQIRQIVAEEVYYQLIKAYPPETGNVKGYKPPVQDYKKQIPKQ
jgi:BRCT domain type II-containing protein|tara:strand:- start:1257 stop:1517 length:261 start_codon:yes stop_codon:yes gene_type:complete